MAPAPRPAVTRDTEAPPSEAPSPRSLVACTARANTEPPCTGLLDTLRHLNTERLVFYFIVA